MRAASAGAGLAAAPVRPGLREGASGSQARLAGRPPADPRSQPSEPILFPKLRIHFADFPYLHYSID